MQPPMLPNIAITGLPGSGKSRVLKSLQTQLGYQPLTLTDLPAQRHAPSMTRPGCFEVATLEVLANLPADMQVWCVIDVRSVLPAEQGGGLTDYLRALLAFSDGVIFSFLEGASLTDQAWWGQWVTQHALALPIVRWLNQGFPANWSPLSFQALKPTETQPTKPTNSACLTDSRPLWRSPLQTFDYSVNRLCLDHLLLGLDASKQNLAMKIVRVQGVVQTQEYANLVAIEGTAYRWDLYAADEDALCGVLKIQGFELEQAWLDQIVAASLL